MVRSDVFRDESCFAPFFDTSEKISSNVPLNSYIDHFTGNTAQQQQQQQQQQHRVMC